MNVLRKIWPVLWLTTSVLLISCGSSVPDGSVASRVTAEVPCGQHTDPRLQEMNDNGIGLTRSLGLAAGRYAVPVTTAPTQLVVFFHGHGNDSCAFRRHLQNITARGAVAVAMDYTGQRQTPSENYGWVVRGGSADSIAATKYFLKKYPSIKQVFAFTQCGGYTLPRLGWRQPSHSHVASQRYWDGSVIRNIGGGRQLRPAVDLHTDGIAYA